MSTPLIWIVTAIYAYCAGEFAWKGDYGHALMWCGYALANCGILLALGR